MEKLKRLQTLLKIIYGIVPIVTGLDKFTNLLTIWPDYLSFKSALPMDPFTFMKIIGVIEIVAGIIVLVRPLIGAYIVAIWLLLIAVQLIAGAHYFDVAVRDIVMAAGAYTLAELTKITYSQHATK